jgi:hypothetical protein
MVSEMLFLWSLLTLPIFLLIRKLTISRFAEFFKKPAAIFLLAVPLVVIESLVNLQTRRGGIREFGGRMSFHVLGVFYHSASNGDCDYRFFYDRLAGWHYGEVPALVDHLICRDFGTITGIIKRFSVTSFCLA